MGKVAFVLRGGISKINGKIKFPNEIYNQYDYINFKCVYNSIKKHQRNVGVFFKILSKIYSRFSYLKLEFADLNNEAFQIPKLNQVH